MRSQIRFKERPYPSLLISQKVIPENIKEYLHHLSMAQASLAELETQIEIAARLSYITAEQLQNIFRKTTSLGKQLYALRNSLLRTQTSTPVT